MTTWIFKPFALICFSLMVFSCTNKSTIKDSNSTSKNETKKTTEKVKKMEKLGKKLVIMETSAGGPIKIELDGDNAPISVSNFLKYVDSGFYDGTIFHRVISTFMVQGGGFTEDMTKKGTNPEIKNEAKNGLKNLRGTLAMARTNVVDSASSQFFINVVDNSFLDHKSDSNYGYAVFGKVIEGMDIVDKIKETPTTSKNGMQDVPQTTVTIKSIKRAE